MGKRLTNNEIISRFVVKEAEDQQLKSQAADEGLEKGKRGSVATVQQRAGTRRRMDAIIIDLIDDWSDPEIIALKINEYRIMIENESKNKAEVNSKRKTHRGRRSRESLAKRGNQK